MNRVKGTAEKRAISQFMNGSYPYWEKELNTVAALVSNVVAAGRSDP